MAKAMSGQFPVTFSIEGIADTVKEAGKGKKLPPVHLWTPPLSGDIDIRIAKDGRWYHDGGEIRRAGLVRVFSTILKREGTRYSSLPGREVADYGRGCAVCRGGCRSARRRRDAGLRFVTNVGDVVDAGPDHAIRIEDEPESRHPMLWYAQGLRRGLIAKAFIAWWNTV